MLINESKPYCHLLLTIDILLSIARVYVPFHKSSLFFSITPLAPFVPPDETFNLFFSFKILDHGHDLSLLILLFR